MLFLCWRKLSRDHGLHLGEASPSPGLLDVRRYCQGPCLACGRGAGYVGASQGVLVAEPLLKREGNLRFAGMSSVGYPADPMALGADVRERLAGVALVPYGPLSLLFSVAPDDLAPMAWDCQVGVAVTGQPVAVAGVSLEDYRNLYALSLPHSGPVRDLGLTHRRLSDHAKGLGYRLRPYWRLALRGRRLADGNLLPVADVAVFIDR